MGKEQGSTRNRNGEDGPTPTPATGAKKPKPAKLKPEKGAVLKPKQGVKPKAAKSEAAGAEGDAVADLDVVMDRVVELVRKHRTPLHIAKLSQGYRFKHGHSVKVEHKAGMRNLIAKHLTDKLLLMGENNDTFVRLNTPVAAAMDWVRNVVADKGPILLSMIGRLYHEEKNVHFNQAFPMGLTKFINKHLEQDLSFSVLKGQEMLVDVKDRSTLRPDQLVKRDDRRKAKGEASVSNGGDGAAAAVAASRAPSRLKQRLTRAPGQVPYKADEHILVLGDGDFSFSRSLAVAFEPEKATKLLATVYDTSKERHRKYGLPSHSHMRALHAHHAQVRHEIDATALETEDTLGGPFDFVVFNYPHVGSDEGLQHSIQENQALLRQFLEGVPALLSDKGEVHVTLLNRYPYTAWAVEKMAPAGRLEFVESVEFEDTIYQHYNHKATSQAGRDTRTRLEHSLTHVFRSPEATLVDEGPPTKGAGKGEGGEGKKKKTKGERPVKRNREERVGGGCGDEDGAGAAHRDQGAARKARPDSSSNKKPRRDLEGSGKPPARLLAPGREAATAGGGGGGARMAPGVSTAKQRSWGTKKAKHKAAS